MAGSYQHLRSGWSHIENMGDAYESTEELLWLVQRAIGTKEAKRLLDAEFYPMKRGEMKPDAAMLFVETKMSA
jgi:hypothetical protein